MSELVIPAPVSDDTNSEETTSTVPDIVEVPCYGASDGGPHQFHWACLREEFEKTSDRSACPLAHCKRPILDGEGRLLVVVRNEGGVTEDFDLGQAFDEDKAEEDMPEELKKER